MYIQLRLGKWILHQYVHRYIHRATDSLYKTYVGIMDSGYMATTSNFLPVTYYILPSLQFLLMQVFVSCHLPMYMFYTMYCTVYKDYTVSTH